MPHICFDEIVMFMAIIPFVGFYFKKLHAWYHVKTNHKAHDNSNKIFDKVSCGELTPEQGANLLMKKR